MTIWIAKNASDSRCYNIRYFKLLTKQISVKFRKIFFSQTRVYFVLAKFCRILMCQTNTGDQRVCCQPCRVHSHACAAVTWIVFDLDRPGYRARSYPQGGGVLTGTSQIGCPAKHFFCCFCSNRNQLNQQTVSVMFQFVSWNYTIFVSDPEPKQSGTGRTENQYGNKRQIRE
jgi:hypothetical protein